MRDAWRVGLRRSVTSSAVNSVGGSVAASCSIAAPIVLVQRHRCRSAPGPHPGAGSVITRRCIPVQHRHRRDFVPVVILRFDPEHRDSRNRVLLRHSRGELDGSQRLVEREQRAAEQSGLLSGDDGDRLRIGEARGGVARCRGRVAALELSRSACALSSAAAPRMLLCARDRGRPRRRRRRIAGKKWRER